MYLINEAYIGKDKIFLEMERCIHKVRNSGYSSAFDSADVESDANWIRLKELLEEKFGFYSVNLIVEPLNVPQAMTIPVSCSLDAIPFLYTRLSANKKDIKYDKSFRFCTVILITTELLFDKNYTDGEILAILLHEVGHNFNEAVLPLQTPLCLFSSLSSLMKVLKGEQSISQLLLELFALCSPGRIIHSKFNNFLAKHNSLANIILFFKCIINIPTLALNFCYSLLMPVAMATTPMFMIPIFENLSNVLVANIFVYKGEIFSDSFAALCGYGPELSSGITKLQTVNVQNKDLRKMMSEVPIFGHIMGLNEFLIDHLMSILDGHPDINARIKTTINMLSKDLNDPRIDRKTKEQIKKDIDNIKKIYTAVNSSSNIYDVSKTSDNYAQQVKSTLGEIVRAIVGKHPDLRSMIADKTYGGANSIKKNLDQKALDY